MNVRVILGVLNSKDMWFKKIVDYLGKAVKSNTGISSLSLIVVAIGVMSIITLIVICICMMIEIIVNKTIVSSLDGYAAIITAIAGLIAAVGIPKAINNFSENKFKNTQQSEVSDMNIEV